jgi:hypothetical protein
MNKHSPGPWMPDGRYIQAKNGAVAETTDQFDDDENTANALLIAAAPDLLYGAKRVLKLLDEGKIVRDITHDGGSDFALRALNVVADIKALMNAVDRAEYRPAEHLLDGK